MNPTLPANAAQGVMLSFGAVYTAEDRKHKSFRTWFDMLYRCHTNKNYLHRKPPIAWYTFANFAADMGDRPDGLSIDRIDNDKPYGPDNCRWATMRLQQNNRGKAIKVTYKGESTTLSYLAEQLQLSRRCLLARIQGNWPEDTWGNPAKECPQNQPNLFVFQGKQSTVAEIATALSVPLETMRARMKAYRKRGLPLKPGDSWPDMLAGAVKPAHKKRQPIPKSDYLEGFYAKHSHLTPPPPLIDRSAIQSPHDTQK